MFIEISMLTNNAIMKNATYKEILSVLNTLLCINSCMSKQTIIKYCLLCFGISMVVFCKDKHVNGCFVLHLEWNEKERLFHRNPGRVQLLSFIVCFFQC